MAFALAHTIITRTKFLPLHCYKVTWGETYSDLHFYVPNGVLVKDTSVVTQKTMFGRVTDGICICNSAGVPVDLQSKPPEYLTDGRTIRVHHSAGPLANGSILTVGVNDPTVNDDGPTIVSAGGTNIRDSLVFVYNNKQGGTAVHNNYAILTQHIKTGGM
jgi:hypothetical protein